MENDILRIARRVQAIAQSGIHFAGSEFDRERYEELRGLSVELAGVVCDTKPSKIRDLFTNETGFQTPKVDIRSVVLKEGKILMVREKIDGVLRDSIETSDAGFFDFDNLPELSVERNTPSFLEMIRKQLESPVTYAD